jgi:hypothetical protein
MTEALKREMFEIVLKPLIKRDYRLREEGKRPDRMYWADDLAMRWGMLRYYD